jgi:hypothetical protein
VEALAESTCPTAVFAGKEKLVLFCEIEEGEPAMKLHRKTAAQLGIHLDGIEVHTIKEIPRTANGKKDYSALQFEVG